MQNFHKDKNKIKKLKVRSGIPLFINFCYNQKIRNKLNGSKLFIENGILHYHLKWADSYDLHSHGKESMQYVVKNITNYYVESNNIIIEGEIEKTKNGLNNKKKINKISLYRIYQDEEKLLEYLKNIKKPL